MGDNLELVEVLQRWLDVQFEGVHTCVPGKILSYSGHSTRIARVEPLVALRTDTGAQVDLPIIDQVPVVFPSSQDSAIVFPVKEGDCVLLVFSESGIGGFLASDGSRQVPPDDQSRFSLTDAIAIPGLWPTNGKSLSGLPDEGLVVAHKSSIIHIDDSGNIRIDAGVGKIEMLNEISSLKAQIDALWDALIQQTTDTATWMTAAAALGGAPVPGSFFASPLTIEQARLIVENTNKAAVGGILQ